MIISDFARISLLDLKRRAGEEDHPRLSQNRIPAGRLHRHIHEFAFILGDRDTTLRTNPRPIKGTNCRSPRPERAGSRGRTQRLLSLAHTRLLFSLAEPESADPPPPQPVKAKRGIAGHSNSNA